MNLKNINNFFGYAMFIVGVLKILLIVLVLIQVGTNIIATFNGGGVNSEYYPVLSSIIGFSQLILAIGSIIMIILNIKKRPQVIIGYLYGLGALLLEFIIPSIMSFYFVFVECGLYMKAGNKIRNANWGFGQEDKINKKMIKNTDWFYSDKKEQIEIQKQQRMGELEKENYESKELSDLMEVDEINYELETNFMKENKITIILVVLIIIIVLSIGVLGWKVLIAQDKQTNVATADMYILNNNTTKANKNLINNVEIKENIISSNSYINMSRYYLESNLGKTSEIYNKMLDVLATQSYISYYGVSNDKNGIYNRRHELDLKNFIEKYEGESSGGKSIGYKSWSGTLETRYSYYEPRGTWEKSMLDWYTQADVIFSFMPLNVMITKQENYSILYEENVIKDNCPYYRIVAQYCGNKEEKITMYIEMESMKLKEVEIISENQIINNYYFEYSDKVLKIPEEILNM